MVYTLDESLTEQDAIGPAFRYYEISGTLTPKVEALVIGLDLVDRRTSSIRCQGRCVNGGTCSQRINQHAVMRSVLQLQILALDTNNTGGELEECLASVYAELLCGSARHRTDEQIQRCVSRAKPNVEEWRRRWAVDGHDQQACVKCRNYDLLNKIAEDRVNGLIGERNRLSKKAHELEKARKADIGCHDGLTETNGYLRRKVEKSQRRVEELEEQLEALQIRHDGMVGRMASEVEEQQKSRASTPARSEKQQAAATAEITPPSTPVRSNTPATNGKQQSTGNTTPPITPSSGKVKKERSVPKPTFTSLAGSTAPCPGLSRGIWPFNVEGGDVLFKSGGLQTSPMRVKKGECEETHYQAPPAPVGFQVRKKSY